MAQVAFASGFGSIRDFNRAMSGVFRSSPRELRERRRRHDRLIVDGGLSLRVPFDPPFDWDASLRYFARRAIPGVESVHAGVYRRTIVLDGDPGVLEVRLGGSDHLLLRAHLPYWEGVIHVVERAARMLGIDTDVTAGEQRLISDSMLAPIVRERPGLRVPGAWGPFEMAVQVIIGEILDYDATREALRSIVRTLGTHIPGLPCELTHAFPSAETIAEHDLSRCGLARAVASAVTEFAAAVAADAIRLDCGAGLDGLVSSLVAVPGVGIGAAHKVALRLGYLDAFPHTDPLIRHAIRQLAPPGQKVEVLAERWRPWRALAATQLVAHVEAGEVATEKLWLDARQPESGQGSG
jgi:AraC family transcriptional regulator of adaptative response / DNA-3-methyladenine glycosylase II